ncbi:MAG TPA: HlyD family efflux transporter periplasmic adaptor subunit [Candidatus Desulfobacillus sp.]|nr:HlyD family efflux transporter periplasmic adaptor subunit [Candidatus Desulfobacillus sp.]
MSAAVAAVALAPLRQDLRLHETGPARDGSPSWAIQDPVSNRFYRIGWLEYECLLRWPGDPARIATEIEAATPLSADAAQVEAFGRFLEQHQLTLPEGEARGRMLRQASQPGWRHWRWWLHHYLFIRIPLVRPQRFLRRLTPWLEPLFSPLALALLAGACLLGLVLTARQWEQFSHDVLDSLTPTGLLGFLLALLVSKTLHELGHAAVATRLGVRVAHMGIAFLVLWPMLYTDTGESWRLRSHRQRLAISVAGIAVELALAGLATLAWALLDDGALRQAALYLATTGWVLTLALNLSPFMRFDGYFILSDLVDTPNLHERSGALARVWLRRALLRLDEPWPETLPARQRAALIGFAFATWLYRLVVFLGIAFLVYAFFFKLLGIFLMAVELAWFIARPVWSELAAWRRRWPDVPVSGRRRVLLLLAMLGLVLMVPWRFAVEAEGLAHAERQQLVFAPFPAMLAELQTPGRLAAGALLASFTTPELAAREARARAAEEALRSRLGGLLEDEEGINRQRALEERLGEQQAEIRGARAEAGRLAIRAEFDGEWRDVSPLLRPGSWVGVRDALGVLVDPSAWVVDAYVEQRLVDRIAVGDAASFLPQGSLVGLAATVVDIDTTRVQRLPHAMLDSRFGGTIGTQAGERQPLPREALYRVRLRLDAPPDEVREMRGSARIEGRRRSLAWEALKGSLAVLIRESGF